MCVISYTIHSCINDHYLAIKLKLSTDMLERTGSLYYYTDKMLHLPIDSVATISQVVEKHYPGDVEPRPPAANYPCAFLGSHTLSQPPPPIIFQFPSCQPDGSP